MVYRLAAVAAAAALAFTLGAAAPPGGHRVPRSPFGNGGSGTCLPNGGNWAVHFSDTAWAKVDWTSRPSGCYIRVDALFKTGPTSGYHKLSVPVKSLNYWTQATANDANDTLGHAAYQWRHCGSSGCGSWSSLHQFYP